MMRAVLPGVPYPLGATLDEGGVNFALYSEGASGVELCLFSEQGEETRIRLQDRTAFVWHAYVPGVTAGTRYGYRVEGPYEPERGARFNPRVVLLDPYARATDGLERWDRGCFAYRLGSAEQDLEAVDVDQLGAPRGVVVDERFDWEDDSPPAVPLHRSVIYEAHVRGLTMTHPRIPKALRGTYSGVAHPAMIRHFQELGITAVELMPVHAFVDEKHLLDKNLRNYWGYSSIGFFAPDTRYRSGSASGSEVREFKNMVKALHRAGIEVILDVVYNHTAEGNHLGPTLSFKGIDNATYYRLVHDRPRYYFDYTGTGNTLNVRHPQVLALIMDSLRYWASEMHVDGFRFDLASSLARHLHEVDKLSSFFTLIHQSPALSHAKIIAEPWDVGDGGYQVGNFPVRWAEWNGRYRDAVRGLWRGDGGRIGEIGYRLTGSSDLYEMSGRRPSASINLITAHDGSTLHDLVTYQAKHNEANGEDNRDGSDHELGWNCGHEGETADPGINALRRRQQRNLLATLFLSQGTPMLLGGDEFGRTQRGNNNAYCQDNAISWFDWEWGDDQRALFAFTKTLIALRRSHPALHRSKFFQGRDITGTDVHDIRWLRPDGKPMSRDDWTNPETRCFGMFLAGRGIDDVDEEGRPIVDDDLLILVNASSRDVRFHVPGAESVSRAWTVLVDTGEEAPRARARCMRETTLVSRSMKFLSAPSRSIRSGGAEHSLGATYRLQLTPDFGFQQARALCRYLADLGITDVYSSPILAAARGSTHGYDVVDHSRLNPALGTAVDFAAWSESRREHGLGLLLDWVPNHMGIASGQNPWWDDVLENGPSSAFADHFDIDWAPATRAVEDRVLLPILGRQYGEVLESGELRLEFDQGRFQIAYFEHRLPVGPKTLVPVLQMLVEAAGLAATDLDREELESIVSALRHLPERSDSTEASRQERAREKEVFKRRLARLVESRPEIARALNETLARVNGSPEDPSSFDRLDELLSAQSYRLASWHVASEEINYRRFFDINELAAIRMEVTPVFEQSHALLFELLDEASVNALRLDHTDGLYDPRGYFESLQRRFRRPSHREHPRPDDLARPLPIVVEKVLEPGEELPASWPVDGTTGYDFASAVTGLWVNRRAETEMTAVYRKFTGDARTFAEHLYESKLQILEYSLSSEVHMLGRALDRISEKNRRVRDFTLLSLTRAITEVLAAFPVYRTYLEEGIPADEQDERILKGAIRTAMKRNHAVSPTLFEFLEDVLLLRAPPDAYRAEYHAFAFRFQQLTGPVRAKAVEDTAFYRYNRLVCLNEVGGDPGHFGTTIEEFHAQNGKRFRAWPRAMVTTSTHDTKRGEDVSATIAVLSEMPGVFEKAVHEWRRLGTSAKTPIEDEPAPSRNLEYLFYQTLVGAWPFGWDGIEGMDEFARRLTAYLVKASKEEKVMTSWTSPNAAYDAAVERFVPNVLGLAPFVSSVSEFTQRIASFGAANGLGQVALKLCSPGVPDTYQGSELWNQSLVDPDNRRPVDFAMRRRYLADLKRERERDPRALAKHLLEHFADGRIKLYVTHATLLARKAHPELFLDGRYQPLIGSEHVVAFARTWKKARLVCCAARLSFTRTAGRQPFAVGGVWGRDTLPAPCSGTFRNILTGALVHADKTFSVAEVLADLPVAVLLLERGAR